MKKRVVITGEGSISPLGHNSKSLWESLVKGNSGIDYISGFNTENFSVKIAGEVKSFEPINFFDAKEARKLDRFTMFSLIAASQALKSSNYNFSEAGVIVGTGVEACIRLRKSIKNCLIKVSEVYHHFMYQK